MKYLSIACFGLSLAACDVGPERRSPLPQPSPVVISPEPTPPPLPPAPPPPPTDTKLISLGEEVKDAIAAGEDRQYALVAPAEGTVIVHLTWTDTGGAFTLRLKLEGTEIHWSCGVSSPWPVEGRVAVAAGQRIRIGVGNGPGCWDYTRAGPLAATTHREFVLTTAMN